MPIRFQIQERKSRDRPFLARSDANFFTYCSVAYCNAVLHWRDGVYVVHSVQTLSRQSQCYKVSFVGLLCLDYALNYGTVAYCGIGNARRAALLAIVTDNCHPSS